MRLLAKKLQQCVNVFKRCRRNVNIFRLHHVWGFGTLPDTYRMCQQLGVLSIAKLDQRGVLSSEQVGSAYSSKYFQYAVYREYWCSFPVSSTVAAEQLK